MATVTNWIDHLSAAEVQGPVYPGVGTEGILVLVLVVIWIGWHIMQDMQETSKSKAIAKKDLVQMTGRVMLLTGN